MSHAYNPYADCPCGSGKKVKFCCAEIAEEIIRVNRLWENNQMDQVKTALEHLVSKSLKNAWSRAWARSTLAMVLQPGDPRQIALIDEVLADVPDHPRANYLKAGFELARIGYPAAREHVERAFENVNESSRRSVARLCDALLHLFLSRRAWMGAARYLNLGMFLEPTEDRMYQLGEFLQSEAPFPLRGAIGLITRIKNFDKKPESVRKDYTAALTAGAKGASHKGARLYEALAKKDPDTSEHWYNAGLCYAWCGENAEAVRCFRESVKRDADFERAVDTEAVAQLLEQPALAPANATVTSWEVTGVSELLSKFDAQPRWIREEPDESGALYVILDRDPPASITFDTAARALAYVDVFEADPEQNEPARLLLRCGPDADRDALAGQIAGLAGEALQSEPTIDVADVLPAELERLYLRLWVPPETKPAEQRAIRKVLVHYLVDQAWPNQALTPLAGKTPLEAAHDAQLKVPLAAAVIVLQSIALEQDLPVDRDAVRERLGLPATELFDLPEGVSARAVSLLELERLALNTVSDEELPGVLEFVQITQHTPLRERVLGEVLSRPELLKSLSAAAIYRSLSRCCQFRFAREEALAWINRARQELQRPDLDPTAVFQMRFELDVEELRIREDNLQDPQLAPLANRVWTLAQKLPEIRGEVAEVLKRVGLSGPWTLAAANHQGPPELVTSGSSLWTPGSEQPAANSGGGLWVPE